jgi:outer membrane protein assembly factor BamE (lipoprotein component of BamABCDE complex)
MLSIFAIGCVTNISEKGWQSQYRDNAILAGYSTEQNVIDFLGTPDKKEHKPDGTYRYVYKTQGQILIKNNTPAETIIEFNKDGVVSSIK